ncbi:hypothetical protein DES53_106389 [Roseimicrobium gellanilyticum]|uniref:Uncharacterized protein n=1 Tax=Roseimicrobium gellanilyticum TaxID=748857 RepID=A0A366HKN0_9BACT|nr:hypothetical protein [Roseimicrobium gellanilyticum]RBP42680.1 hypothetical protein DES53_106389 [Roseimicrobium gellanilyticum]
MKRRSCLRAALLFFILCQTTFPGASIQAEEEKWDVPLEADKDGWKIYRNARFGMVLPVPPGLTPTRPPDNGDGQAFKSADGKVTLLVYGSFNIDGLGDVAARWKTALAAPDRTITYKRKTEEWYVVSGVTKDGIGFYERYTANSKYCSGWEMTYPQSEEKKYSTWIERIAKGYEARLGKGVDTLE